MPAEQPALPPAFLQRMKDLLGGEFEAFLSAYNQPPVFALRVNTLKISTSAFERLSPFPLRRIPWCPEGYQISEEAQAGKHPYHAAGLYYLQEPSAMLAIEALNPQRGEKVLDLAAAPGGKATHIASRMEGEGLLIANEIHPRRVWELAENLERWGATNVVITNESPQRLAERLEMYFDRVLLDAPCSGEGMFRKNPEARLEWSIRGVKSCARRQKTILDQAARLVRPGGWLLYSTCTFAPEENEEVVASFLEEHREYELTTLPQQSGFATGRSEWCGRPGYHLERTVRLWPHRINGEGHFYALLRRTGGEQARRSSKAALPRLSRQAENAWMDFARENLTTSLEGGTIVMWGSYLYWLSGDIPDLSGLRVVHPGLWLGRVQEGRFEPAHALAMALKGHQARQQIHLMADEAQVSAYLRGETFASAGEDGWVLITVDGYPLGWGKRLKNIMKNYYPHGLRLRG